MKKNSPVKRTISTRSLKASTTALKQQEKPDSRRSIRGTPSKKPITPASGTRKSERLASSPGVGTEKSGGMEKKDTGAASSLQNKGKNESLQSAKGSVKNGGMEKKDTAAASSLQRSDKGKNESSKSAKGSDKTSGMDKKDTAAASTLQMSDKGKNESSQSSKGLDKSCRSSDTSPDIEQRKNIEESNLEELTNQIKKRQPKMTGRAYRASLTRVCKENQLRKKDTGTDQVGYINGDSAKGVAVASAQTAHEASKERDLIHKSHMKEVNASSNDEELLVVGCSRRIPASNDDARDVITDCPPHADPESKRRPVGETSLEKGTNFSLESIKDTEKMVRDPSSVVESKDDSVIGSPSEDSETEKLLVSKNSLEIDIDLPLKRKRDAAGAVMDACGIAANEDNCMMSSDGVIPSPSGCKTSNLPETCRTCKKRQKVNGDVENLSVCSCIAQPVQESDHGTQHMKETGPATSRDHGENRQNMQHDKPYDPKLSSMYPEYWVPVQLSDVQLEQYCWTLFSKSLSLSSLVRKDHVGALEETLTSVRKTCDHPYLVDASLKQLLSKNLKSPLVDVEVKSSGKLHLLDAMLTSIEVKASGKLHLLDAMLTQIKKNNLKAVVYYQATENTKGFLLGTILEDFVMRRFGLESYEHVVCLKKKNAVNNFNKESQCFVLLLERRACSQSIKLLRAEAFIVFGSSLNPSQDVKLLERIKIESHSERTNIFRLYSTCTVEEKVLILARQRKPLENPNRQLMHALLMWGSSRLFDKLDQFHISEAAESGIPFQQSIEDSVICEFSSILSSKVGEENEGKLCLLLKVKHDQGIYSTNSTLFGEEHVKLSDEDSPNIFWAKLLGGKNPTWKYCSGPSGTRQRNRKRVQYFQDSEESNKVGDGGNTKKRKKASDDVTDPPVDNVERKGTGKDHMGTVVLGLKSSSRSPCGTSNEYDAFASDFISGIPEDMLAGRDRRQMPHESQRSLHAILKPEMAKLCQVLHLSEDLTSMVEKFLEYVIENYHVCEEPATSLQAFQIALSWIAAILVEQKIELKESLVRAKSELAFSCSREEVNYVYSFLYCMKSVFLERTQGLKLDCPEKRGSRYSLAIKDIEKTIGDIKRKYKKEYQKLEQKHEEKKVELMNKYADMARKLEEEKKVEMAVISIQCARTSSLAFELKRLDNDYERKFDEITSEKDECLKILEQTHEAAKKRSTGDKACWISRIENWAQAELINCAPIKSGDNKHFSGVRSSKTSKHAPDVQTCNDASGDTTCADAGCQEELVALNMQLSEKISCDRVTSAAPDEDVSSRLAELSHSCANQPESASPNFPLNRDESSAAKENNRSSFVGSNAEPEVSQSCAYQSESASPNLPLNRDEPSAANENYRTSLVASDTEPEVPQSCANRPESASPNLPLNRDEPSVAKENNRTSLAGSDVEPEVSQSCASQPESTSPNLPLNRDEHSAAKENNRTSLVGSDAENSLDQLHEEACSVDKEIRDELAFPLPHPPFVVESRGSAAFSQDHQELCPMPSSPAEKQSDTGENIQERNIEAAIEPQPAGSETVESGGFAASEQVPIDCGQDTRPFPFSPAEIQPEPAAHIEGQNIETSAGPHITGPDAVEIGDSAVSDQGTMGDQDAGTLPSSVVGSQSDLAATIEGQNIITAAQLHNAGSGAIETGGSAASDQGAQDRSPLPFSSLVNHPDTAVHIEGLNNTTVVYPHTNGSDASEREIAEPGPPVEQSTVANNLGQLVREGSVEPSADVTAPVQSLLNNGPGQSAVQPVPQIPFPVFSDPFQYELEKLRRESENTKKTYDEKKSFLKAERERKMAELQAEYQRKFHEVDAEHNTKVREIETNKSLVIMNKLLASAFLSKCTDKNASHSSAPSRGNIQQLAQRAAIVNALRNYTALPPTSVSASASAPAPAPVTIPLQVRHFPPVSLQPRESSLPSSVPRPSGLPLNSVVCPLPQPSQPVIYNTGPSASASPVTNSAVTAKLCSPAPHLNAYRSSSSTRTTTVSPQSIAHSTVILQPQQQEQNLGSGLQNSSNDLVYLSDDE